MRWIILAAFAAAFMLPSAPADAQTSSQCHGVVRIFYNADGTVRRMRLVCQGDCPDRRRCQADRSGNHHGGQRQWCDCDRDGQEPTECHVVLYTPGAGEGGGPPQVLCAGRCNDPAELCEEIIVRRIEQRRGRYIEEIGCQCL